MLFVSLLVVVAVSLSSVSADAVDGEKYRCGACVAISEKMLQGKVARNATLIEACEDVFPHGKDLCDHLPTDSTFDDLDTNPRSFCQSLGMCPDESNAKWRVRDSAATGAFDVRVSKALGARGYNQVRLSIISNYSISSPYFSYSQPFKYRWTNNSYIGNLYLNTGIVTVNPGTTTSFVIDGQTIDIPMPAQNEGVRGIIIADPCFQSAWCGCAYQDTFKMFDSLTGLLNSAMSKNDMHFFQILGDNFYDLDGNPTAAFFNALSPQTKSKVMMTVPGNHDYWVMGAPTRWVDNDQLGNGFMQFYAQDVMASKKDPTQPYDFSVDPDKFDGQKYFSSAALPPASDFFFYNQVGNIATIGFSGGHAMVNNAAYFAEACHWAAQQNPDVILLAGHWVLPGDGCLSGATPAVYAKLAAQPACMAVHSKFRYLEGHMHCNKVTKADVGFMMGGYGNGASQKCGGQWGLSVVDSTGGKFNVYYFHLGNATSGYDNYSNVQQCIDANGVSGCYDLATLWSSVPL